MILVDINLLPKKEEKSFQSMMILIAAATLFLGLTTWIGLSYYVNSSTLQEKKQLLQQEKKLVEVKMQSQTTPVISASPLVEKIEYIRGKDIAAAELLQHLVALLPERGFFMKYEYKDKSTITVEAQFDTLDESSQYLYELTNSPYLTEASIEKMETTNLDEVEEGKDMSVFENILPRYSSQYKIKFNKDKLVELKGEE
ncbi:PilN domain-containing protein [Fictibacillus barbaricus]|uniref:Type IV pilus assembly protein PilN n=1 Tax=Fictibacillus barbaricus TaxID=182136 RepID=A0ABU1U0Y5_9BACL|nr:hypothetical protein [Fictibacillus barbaricus]MDR7073136.1 hypothetical protein [Fictibacillus barbaricus]